MTTPTGDTSREETALVEQARRGDVIAYEKLMERYQDLAMRAAYLVTRDATEAEDATQEAFVKAYYALDRFRPGAPVRPWLLRIVVNEARNRCKAAGRRAALALRLAGEDAMGQNAPSAENVALTTEQRAMLLRALDELREEDRLVITYRPTLSLSEAETADALGCPRGTVKSRLSRALERLRQQLDTEHSELDTSTWRSVPHG